MLNRTLKSKPAQVFTKWGANRSDNQLRQFHAQEALRIAQVNYPAMVVLERSKLNHELMTLPTRQEEAHVQAQVRHQVTLKKAETEMVQEASTQELTKKAFEEGMTLATKQADLLEENKVKHDVSRAEQMAKIELMKKAGEKYLDEWANLVSSRLQMNAAVLKEHFDELTLEQKLELLDKMNVERPIPLPDKD